MSNAPSFVWFRLDLRLADNPALMAARERGNPVIPVFIWSPEEEKPWQPGAASRWWLHQSLAALAVALEAAGSRLIIREGPALKVLRALIDESGAEAVFWNRRYEPAVIARDQQVKEALRKDGIVAESSNAALLFEPWTVRNQSGRPFQVFTPYWRHCLARPEPPEPLPSPRFLVAPKSWPQSATLADLKLEPATPWDKGMGSAWEPGEKGARKRLRQFPKEGFADYAEERDRPDHAGTSRFSPYLHFGEISPRQIWQALREIPANDAWKRSQFAAEIGWREFAHHLLYHFPKTPDSPLRKEWGGFPVRHDGKGLRAWSRGLTGYPMVDAGMRELWTTGWMHNRVRMIVASFLVKDLMISWVEGARWFWDTLVDADLASNTLGWQWTAGCGADAAPYFRIFNPVSQGRKFDPGGNYVRKWCPELARLPTEWAHAPWEAGDDVLTESGVVPGKTYPKPIVDHGAARKRALAAYSELRKEGVDL